MLKVPIFGEPDAQDCSGPVLLHLLVAVRAGVPVLESLDITKETVNNVVVARAVESMAEGVQRGEPMTARLSQHPIFPAMVAQMMSVGEETGALDAMLGRAADFSKKRSSARSLPHIAAGAPDDRGPGRLRRHHGDLSLPAHVQGGHAHQRQRMKSGVKRAMRNRHQAQVSRRQPQQRGAPSKVRGVAEARTPTIRIIERKKVLKHLDSGAVATRASPSSNSWSSYSSSAS